MSNTSPRTIKDRLNALDHTLFGSALVAALLGCGLAMPLHAALGLTGSVWSILLYCVAWSVALAVIHFNRWTLWIGGAALVAAVVIWALRRANIVANFPAVWSLLSAGHIVVLRLFSGVLNAIFCMVFTILGFSLARRSGGFYPALSLTLVVLLGVWFYGDRSQIVLCLPALLALMVLYALSADHGTALRRILPMAVAAVLLAFILMPTQNLASKPLENGASRVRELIYDYLFFTEPRTSYSLQSDGYQPMGDRLGGPADPLDRPVMEVACAHPMLLRGTIKDAYTGLNWHNATSSRRNLFIDPRFGGERDALFDTYRPGEAVRGASALFSAEPVEVKMLAPGVSTLFMPQRFSGLQPGKSMVPYYNASSEIFITRDTAPDDTYGTVAYAFTADSLGVKELVESLRGQGTDKYYDEVAKRYLDVPEAVSPAVQDLANQWVQGANTPFEKAMAITLRLRSDYPYSLEQGTPPEARDFVSWFLLEEKKGYCTSFASALAVMGRQVGLPTRYIEGYAAMPQSDGIARVSGLNAHAWVEIYFDNFGWLPFDATPSDDPNHDPNQDNPPQDGDEPAPSSTPSPSPPPDGSTPTPSDNSAPTPPPSEEPKGNDSDPNATPTPTPTPTPAPTPEQTPTPPPNSTPPPPPPDDQPPEPPFWLLWMILPLLLAALAWRIYCTHPLYVAAKQEKGEAKLMVWYRALCQLLVARGVALNPAESPLAYFERAEHALAYEDGKKRNRAQMLEPVSLIPIAAAVCSQQYGAREVEQDTFEYAYLTYRALWKRLSMWQKLSAVCRRTLRGVGDIRQVP